ncbi:MAG: hypothetical protein Q4G34_01275 [Micrococcus sp.]|nr:hypothetical protein [Micrococcus sp.]
MNTAGLREGARALRDSSSRVREALSDAHGSWAGLQSAYRHDGTQDRVREGLDVLNDPVADWGDALVRCADRLADFAGECDVLLFRRGSLEMRRSAVEAQRAAAIASEDPATIAAATSSVQQFNGEVSDLTTVWQQTDAACAADIAGIAGGEYDALPPPGGEGGTSIDWSGLGQRIALVLRSNGPAFRQAEAAAVLAEVEDLSASAFVTWVRANPGHAAVFLESSALIDWLRERPDVAQALVDRSFPASPRPGTPEAAMARFVHTTEGADPATDRGTVVAVREQWDLLDAREQTYLLFAYPNVFGNMNGVPLDQRGQMGAVNVRGHLENVNERQREREGQATWEERIPGYDDMVGLEWAHPKGHVPSYGTALARQQAEDAWLMEGVELGQNSKGLTLAWQQYVSPTDSVRTDEPSYRTLFVDTSGRGQVVSMQGAFFRKTTNVNTFTPGAYTTMADVQNYNRALHRMTGEPRNDTVNIYWAGTDFPGSFDSQTGEQLALSVVTDNMTSRYNTAGAARLATFDQAVDLEAGEATQTTIAHSAGAALAGTAERHDFGMTTDKFLYLAPGGNGYQVGSPQDTVNPDADRAVLQTREDPIKFAQRAGGGFHGGSVWAGGDPVRTMGAKALETGMTSDPATGDSVRVGDLPHGGHSALWEPRSTSRAQIEAFIYGGDVIAELPDEVRFGGSRGYLIDGLAANPELRNWDDFDEYKRPYSEVFE